MIHDAAPKASAGLNGEWWELQYQTGPIPTETSAAEHSLGHALRSADRVSPPSTGHPGCERCEWLGTGATVRKLLPGQACRSTSAAAPTHLGVSVLARKAVGLMHYYFMLGFAPEECSKIKRNNVTTVKRGIVAARSVVPGSSNWMQSFCKALDGLAR